MNILSVLLPLLMALMLGFGATKVIQMMHGIIHGRSGIAGADMLQNLTSGLGKMGGEGSPLQAGLDSLSPKAPPPANTGSGGIGDTATAGGATSPLGSALSGLADAGMAASGLDTTVAHNGSSENTTGVEEESVGTTDAPLPEAGIDTGADTGTGDPATSEVNAPPVTEVPTPDQSIADPVSSGGANLAGPQSQHRVLSAAGKALGTYRKTSDSVRTRYQQISRPIKIASLYAKSTRTAYIGRALIKGDIVNAPQALHAMYPQMRADTKFRHQQMRNVASKALTKRIEPYVPTTSSSSSPTSSPQFQSNTVADVAESTHVQPVQEESVQVSSDASASPPAYHDPEPGMELGI